MSQPDTLAQLAALVGPCTYRNGDSDPNHDAMGASCPKCSGSGTVPLVQGLRVPCSDCDGIGWCSRHDMLPRATLVKTNPPYWTLQYRNQSGEVDWKHLACAGTGYTVLSGAEALLVLLEWATAQGWWFTISRLGVSLRSPKGYHYGVGSTILDRVASAVAQALGLEVLR